MRRLRRSELATPGSNPAMIAKAASSEADEVFLDLEDAVAPAERPRAREHVVDGLTRHDWGRKVRAVRINAVDGDDGLDDLFAVVEGAGGVLDTVIVPKVGGAREVHLVDRLLGYLERRHGVGHRIGIEVLIETVEGLARVREIAAASERLETLIVGVGDLAASQGARVVGVEPDAFADSALWLSARSQVVAAAREAGIEAIDGPFVRIADTEGYERLVREARTMGFSGKWAIHPLQLPLANAGFGLQPAEARWLERIDEVYAPAVAAGTGAIAMDGELVDAAHLLMAARLRRLAELTAPPAGGPRSGGPAVDPRAG
jgi:citrate lyase subunit beta / citryl-CoA lyase